MRVGLEHFNGLDPLATFILDGGDLCQWSKIVLQDDDVPIRRWMLTTMDSV